MNLLDIFLFLLLFVMFITYIILCVMVIVFAISVYNTQNELKKSIKRINLNYGITPSIKIFENVNFNLYLDLDNKYDLLLFSVIKLYLFLTYGIEKVTFDTYICHDNKYSKLIITVGDEVTPMQITI